MVPTKQTVFARLGSSEPTKPPALTKTISTKSDAKPIFSRLGSKSEQVIPVPKDALKYEGILKSPPTMKKVVMVTTTTQQNSIRKIACTMRADETPVSVKEKLALPRTQTTLAKSVKFSNTVLYKEIEANHRIGNVKPKITAVFNKPERRLSMPELPEPPNVKARLGVKNANNIAITKNVFKRLGV